MTPIIAEGKYFSFGHRPKPPTYMEDMAEFARLLLTTTEMRFTCSWFRMQLLLFYQLVAVTLGRPQTLLDLRYRNLEPNLIHNPNGGRPRLSIHLTRDFIGQERTVRFSVFLYFLLLVQSCRVASNALGNMLTLIIWHSNTVLVPEVIYDLTLVLTPRVFLLGMLF